MPPSEVISGLSGCSLSLLGVPTTSTTSDGGDALLEVSRGLGDTCYLSAPVGGSQQQQSGSADCEGCRGLIDGMSLYHTTHQHVMGGVLDELDAAMYEKERETTKKLEGGKKGGKPKSKNTGAAPPMRRFHVDSGLSAVDVLKQAHSMMAGGSADTIFSPPWWLTSGWWCRAFFPAPLGVTGPTRSATTLNSCCLCPTTNNRDHHAPSLLLSEFEQAIAIILGACNNSTQQTPSPNQLEYVPRCELNAGYTGGSVGWQFSEISSIVADPLEPMESRIEVLGHQLLEHLGRRHHTTIK